MILIKKSIKKYTRKQNTLKYPVRVQGIGLDYVGAYGNGTLHIITALLVQTALLRYQIS